MVKLRSQEIKPIHANQDGEQVSVRPYSSNLAYGYLMINLLMLALSGMGFYSTSRASSNWPEYIVTIVIIWCAVYLIYSIKQNKSIYVFSNGFILALLIFHISHLMLHYLGMYDFSHVFYDDEMGVWYYKAGWLILISLGSYGIGLALATKKRDLRPIIINEHLKNQYLGQSLCWWYGVGLLVISILMMIWLFASIGNIFAYSRRELFGGVGDTRGFGLFQMFFPSALVLLVIGARTRLQKIWTRVLAVGGVLFILFLGYRSVALFPMLIGLIIWVKLGRRLDKKFIAVTLVFLIIAIPAVKTIRHLGSYDSITLEDISESVEQAKADEIFLELGAISGIIAYTVKWVPEEESYRYGKTYYLALKNSIPNIGFTISKSNREIAEGMTDKQFLHELSASDWFIFKYSEWMYETGGGSGYSVIAEPYLNFGVPGVVVFFVLLGFYLGKIDSKDLLNSPLLLLFCASMMWPVLKLVRNDITTFLKPMVFTLIVMIFWKVVTFWKNYKKVPEKLLT